MSVLETQVKAQADAAAEKIHKASSVSAAMAAEMPIACRVLDGWEYLKLAERLESKGWVFSPPESKDDGHG